MTTLAEKLKKEVLQLPASERAELAYCLIHSLDEGDEGIQAAWEDELTHRWQDIESDEKMGEPAPN